jgi:LytS/YehU family sensor histidine kinase
MNPHFIFNALNTIQSYIYLNDKPNAISYLGKFSSLTRLILEMSNHEKVCLRDEVEALKLYLELEKMRFEESLDMEIDIEPSIKVEQCFIPTMLIQPYVENAVKHGLLHKKDNRSVRILFRLKPNDMLEVTIEDNGIGRKRSAELNAKSSRHKPFSTEANQKRLEIMNKAIPEGFTVTYIDRVDAQGRAEGTTVVLLMPLK